MIKTIDEANLKIKSKFSYLTILKFTTWSGEAVLLDDKFGEFYCKKLSNVFYNQKSHPERSKEIAIRKRKETMFEKYGVENPMHSEDLKEKQKEALLNNYGVDNPSKSEIIKEKKKNTTNKNYGVDNPAQNKDIYDKIKDTNLIRYGVEYLLQSESIKVKATNTNLKRYGVTNPLQNEKIKEKIKQTNIERYGVENPVQNKRIRDKINQTNLNRYGFKSHTQLTAERINGKTYAEIAQEYNYSYIHIYKYIKDGGELNNLSVKSEYSSSLESVFFKTIGDKVGISVNSTYFKSGNYKYKPDFIIDDLLIECDGLYWHSDSINKNDKYHKEKQEKYKELGYRSLFFREDEILNKTNIVESIILAKLGRFNDRVFARKTKIIELPSKKASSFFEENHLMGRGSGQCYALTYEDKIVSAIRIIKKKDYIDISRFCSALNTKVVGGLGKLLKHIIREHNPQKIISFVDMRYGDGHSLEKLGFVEKTNHVSFKWTDFKNTYHRLNFKGNSGYEKGLFKIWDCGQKKFELLEKLKRNCNYTILG